MFDDITLISCSLTSFDGVFFTPLCCKNVFTLLRLHHTVIPSGAFLLLPLANPPFILFSQKFSLDENIFLIIPVRKGEKVAGIITPPLFFLHSLV